MTADGAMQMAIDEAIMIARIEGRVPDTVRFYAFQTPITTIGCHQNYEKKFAACVRRLTGGSAVFHNNDFTYMVVMAQKGELFDIDRNYYYIGDMLLAGLKELGVTAQYSNKDYQKKANDCYLNENPYDIEVDGKKISGNAQTNKHGVVLQQGTLIIDNENPHINALNKVLKQKINMSLLLEKMHTGFVKELKKKNIRLESGQLTKYEKDLAKKLYEQKYKKNSTRT